MFLNELLETGAKNISVNVSLDDLRKYSKELIQETKKELEEVVISEKAETYPSPKQVSEILNVDQTTLWRWAKRGYLIPIKIGGKNRYRMSEVKAMLNSKKR